MEQLMNSMMKCQLSPYLQLLCHVVTWIYTG